MREEVRTREREQGKKRKGGVSSHLRQSGCRVGPAGSSPIVGAG